MNFLQKVYCALLGILGCFESLTTLHYCLFFAQRILREFFLVFIFFILLRLIKSHNTSLLSVFCTTNFMRNFSGLHLYNFAETDQISQHLTIVCFLRNKFYEKFFSSSSLQFFLD